MRQAATPIIRRLRHVILPLACILIGHSVWHPALAEETPISQEDEAFFESQVRPILVRRCYECHSSDTDEPGGDLSLDSRSGWERGGSSGPAIEPGNINSRVLIAVGYEDPDLQMPPDSRLPEHEIDVLREWVVRGAPDPRVEERAQRAPLQPDLLEEQKAKHWSWQQIRRPAVPDVSDRSWSRDDLDRFILSKLESQDLQAAPPLAKIAWLRRVTFALRGMPPTVAEAQAYLADDSPQADAAVVDRLLASDAFGERWAGHWLDLVRYAETHGHEQDFPIPLDIFSPEPLAYRYRDYVIRAWNADVPYNQFVTEHIAGDLMANPRIDPESRTNQSIQGTGFWLLGEGSHSPVDIRGDEADRMANQVDVFSKTFLGLTVGCARCHDHKFDAIRAADYYALCGFMRSSNMQVADVSDPEKQGEIASELAALREQYAKEVAKALAASMPSRMAKFTDYFQAALSWSVTKNGSHGEAELEELARQRGLSADRLGKWVEEIRQAVSSPGHPLWNAVKRARGTADDATDSPVSQESHPVQERAVKITRKQDELRTETISRPWTPADIILDYGQCGPNAWFVAGHRFGARPVQPGKVVLGSVPATPIQNVVTEASARADMLSDHLTGMLRTPTFEITSDTLWYRYQGEADVLLSVDSHRVIAGPLHGVLRQHLKAPDNGWHWHAHRVSDYLGHLGHVEFRPAKGFAISRAEFSDGEPPGSTSLPAGIDPSAISASGSNARECAEPVAADILQSIESLEKPECDRVQARLAAWVMGHCELFEDPSPDDSRAIAKLLEEYHARRAELESLLPEPVWALALMDGDGVDEPIHIRGNHRTLSEETVPRRSLEALDGPDAISDRPGSGRLKLAEHLVRDDNPLVARVYVNRVWHHLFGRGIAATVDDLGVMGTPPTHPELLDYLAAEFRDGGWSTKRLIRRLVLSQSYRMSGRAEAAALERDPTNQLWSHVPPRRLEAEAVRDAMLSVSGRLDTTMYGPSVYIHIPEFLLGNRSPGRNGPLDGAGRRSIYLEVRRNHPSHFLAAFDRPVPFTTMGRRNVSNTPAQSLILLNDEFSHAMARQWAASLLACDVHDAEAVIESAYWTAFSRAPEAWERDAALELLEQSGDGVDRNVDEETLFPLCHALFNVKEFIFSP